MTVRSRRRAGAMGCAIAMFLLMPRAANAEPIELIVTPGPSIQQILNSPCIIGDPSCNNPLSFPYTLIHPSMEAGTLSSPTYTVDQIREIVGGDTFYVDLDLNQAMGRSGGAFTLSSFTLSVDGAPYFVTPSPASLTPTSPGNGYSDASIGFFDLSGLAGSQTLVFTAAFSGASAGREQFFLRAATNGQPGTAPEPATMLLIGTGLAGVAAVRRRRGKSARG